MRRNVSAPDWRFPLRMTYTQWSVLPYRDRHAYLAQAQCTLLGYWRDCAKARCRRAQRCLVPHPCYWERQKRDAAGRMGEGGSGLPAAARAVVAGLAEGLGRPVAVLN
ncbi:MAG: hypothetical protein ACLP19_21205 [Xanthobacteraceae bacterium]